MRQIVIIGNGIAGITAARHIRRLSDQQDDPVQGDPVQITVISAESDHFYARTALMYIYMGHMTYAHTKPYEDWFWAKNRIDLRRDTVQQVDTSAKQLLLASGQTLTYDTLVIATGSTSLPGDWPGRHLPGVQGLYGLPDLDRMEQQTRGISRAVVVGGGLIGVELAEMLCSRRIAVTLLVRDAHYWGSTLPAEEGALISRHIRQHGVDLRLETEVASMLPDADGRVHAVVTTSGEELPAQFVGLAIGVTPNIDFLKTSAIELGRGVLVNAYFETSEPDVYAIGDCTEFRQSVMGSNESVRKSIEQIWYTGRMHGETVAQTICGQRAAYQPGVFFNSAKFFDIEYQTYGTMAPQSDAGTETFYWEQPERNRCLRINYTSAERRVIGIHGLGLRLRHAVCEAWIREGKPLDDVLRQFGQANFDPEFSRPYDVHSVGKLSARTKWWQRLFH